MDTTARVALFTSGTTVLTVIIGASTRKQDREAEAANLQNQRSADQARFEAQLSSDAARLREQREADERKRQEELEQGLIKGHDARLNAAAAEFLTVLGEALAAAQSTRLEYQNAVRQDAWTILSTVHKHWTSDIKTRLAVATAKMRVFNNHAAVSAHEIHLELLGLVNECIDSYRRGENWPIEDAHDKFAPFIAEFSANVVKGQWARRSETSEDPYSPS